MGPAVDAQAASSARRSCTTWWATIAITAGGGCRRTISLTTAGGRDVIERCTSPPGRRSFEVRGDRLQWSHEGPGAPPAPVKFQWSIFDNNTGGRRILPGEASQELPEVAESVEYLEAELSGAQGPSIRVYVRISPDCKSVVGVERDFTAEARK